MIGKMLRETIRDIKRDVLWFLLLTLFSAVILASLYRAVESSGVSKEYEESYYALKDMHPYFIDVNPIDNQIGNAKQRFEGIPNVLEAYFRTALKEDGPAGLMVNWGFSQGESFQEGVFLIGKARLLTNYQGKESPDIRVLGSESQIKKSGALVSVGNKQYEVELVPEDLKIYMAYSYQWKSSLVFFCPDLESFLAVAGESSLIYMSSFLRDLVLVDPAEEDILACKKAVLNGANATVNLMDLNTKLSAEFLRSGMLQVQSTLWYNVMALIGLLSSILLIQYRLIYRRFPTYAICHLYGFPLKLLFFRIWGYCLTQYILAAVGAIWLLVRVVGIINPPPILPFAALCLGMSGVISAICFYSFKQNKDSFLWRNKE